MTPDSIWPLAFSYDFNSDATADLVRVLDRSQDTLERPSGYQLKNGSTIEATASYQYGPTTGRLENVGNGTDTFTYAYTTNSSLLASVTKSGTPTLQTTHTWEANRNVLDVKENKVGSTVISSYDYTVNTLGQRTAVDTAGTAFAAGERDRTWTYDALGQVTAESDANNTAYHRGFAYDAIGNRLSSIDGNTDPTQPGATTYTPTALNQYSQISVPSVPSVVPTYDADGNQLASQIRPLGASGFESCLFVWDGENRLIEIKDAAGTNSLAQYSYDTQSRRIARTVGGTTLATIYDGWNPIAEYLGTPATGYSLQAFFSWGLDLSGSMQGAGGVGGLLSVTSGTTSFYPTYDGNGNVSEYLDAAGAIAAHYEYDAFGNVIFSSGPSSSSFRHRFSTKPQDAESGLYYYGYRYYDPVTGRWPSRDPIGEEGGLNLYGFVGNDAIRYIDALGLKIQVRPVTEGDSKRSKGWNQRIDSNRHENDRQGRDQFDKDFEDFKKRLEESLEEIRKCCKKHADLLGDLSICKMLESDQVYWITVTPPRGTDVDNGRLNREHNDVEIEVPHGGPNAALDHEVYTDNGQGGYDTSAQTIEPLLTHEFEHLNDHLKSDGDPSKPSDSYPEGPEHDRARELWSNPWEEAGVAAENRLRKCCKGLKLPQRSRYTPPN